MHKILRLLGLMAWNLVLGIRSAQEEAKAVDLPLVYNFGLTLGVKLIPYMEVERITSDYLPEQMLVFLFQFWRLWTCLRHSKVRQNLTSKWR